MRASTPCAHAIERDHAGSPLEPVLLTSLLEAADRVDSTTGVQMAYVKQWSDRSFRPLELRVPALLSGPGHAVRGDACVVARQLGEFDLAYLDPPYNQHRYEANYHIWETIVAWDAPEHYGVACKRTEVREGARSAFNSRRTMPAALAQAVRDVRARLLVLSYNDESWMTLDELLEVCGVRGHVEVLAFPSDALRGGPHRHPQPCGRAGGICRAPLGTSSTWWWRGTATRSATPSLPGVTPPCSPAHGESVTGRLLVQRFLMGQTGLREASWSPSHLAGALASPGP